MRIVICVAAVLAAACAASGACAAGVAVPEGFTASAMGQNFMGGFDYLPNGDIIGMYTDPNMVENAYLGVIDANGDGIPTGVERVHEFGEPTFGIAVRVSPDGRNVLFGDSFAFKAYSMSLDDYSDVREIVPSGATFAGAFDVAFIDDSSCYVSANPGAFPATVNKIFHLDLATGELVELVSVAGTYAAPIDVDDEGNLYYVRGKAQWPVGTGDFTLLKFDATKLEGALDGGTVLGQSDAAVVASGLDGGYGVAWHGSGDVFVADANNGKIYRVAAGGAISDFASLPGGQGEGFNALSIFERQEPFSGGERSDCQLATNYLPLNRPGVDVYLISALPPLVNAVVSSKALSAGSRLALTVTAQPQARPFDGYIALLGPGGAAFSVTGKGLVPGVAPYVSAVPVLAQEYKARVIDMTVPPAAAGPWTIYAGMMPAGAPPVPAAALALDTVGIVLR